MDPVATRLVFLLLLAAVGLLWGAAWVLWQGSDRRQREQRAVRRVLGGSSGAAEPAGPERFGIEQVDFLREMMHRAGMDSISPALQLAAGAAAVLGGALLGLIYGWMWALAFLLLACPALLLAYLAWRTRVFSGGVVDQLPAQLDMLSRSIAVGNTMSVAMRYGAEQSRAPLRGVLQQVLRRNDVGVSLEDALTQVGALYRNRELGLLASVVAINARFGGRIEPLLNNLATTLREADRARRELHALTAETRFSAWVLGLVPIVVALMINANNPEYLQIMLQDPAGRWMLLGAFLLEAVGVAILFRLARA